MRMVENDFYTVLGLQVPSKADELSVNQELLKTAYRKALLQNHPDRKSEQEPTTPYTIDQILEAYQTLADPIARIKYNAFLLKQRADSAGGLTKTTARSAVEVVDLEDLQYVESASGGLWKKSCRCGGTYQVEEQQLEEVASEGEIVTGCHGCSLSIKVVFNAVDG